MAEPVISVIIPTYNRLEYVQVAVESVLEQTYPNYEVIVIDDGSTDGTGNFISEKYGNRVNYHYRTNQGRSAARNLGASLAKGTYLAFLDSDDVWMPFKLQTQITEFVKHEESDVSAVCSSVYFIDASGALIHKKPLGQHPNLYHYRLERFFVSPIIIAPPSNMLIRKEFYDKVNGFDETMSYGEDWDLIIRLRQLGRFVYIDQPLIYFRFNSRFTNRLPREEQIPKMLDDMRLLYRKISSTMAADAARNFLTQAETKVCETAAYWYFARKAYATAVDYLIRSGKPQRENSNELMSNLGYWAAYGALESNGKNAIQCEEDVVSNFFPGINSAFEHQMILSKNDNKKFFASFYHNLAWHLFPSVNGKIIRDLCLKAIYNNPLYLISKQTLNLILTSILCKENGFWQ